MIKTMCDDFIAANKDQANFTIEVGVQSESTAKDTILTDPTAAADVFAFADDQINELVAAGALQAVVENTDAIIAANSSASIDAASVDGTLYAYPMTASNGYFMFYNKEYFSDDDVKTIDGMLAAAATAGKQITMQLDSTGYFYWEPGWLPVPGVTWATEAALAYTGEKGPGGNEWANQALFDYEGNALPSLKTIRDYYGLS